MRFKTIALSFAAACGGASIAAAAEDVKGVWLNDTGRGAIEIKDCGGKLCGHVVWTRDETDASRGCGKQIIGDTAAQGNGLWDGGWIYSPDKKRRYDVELKPLSDGTLRVKGYAGTKLFSKIMIWTPAPADLKRCDATSIEAKATPDAVPQAKAAGATSSVSATSAAVAPAKAAPAVTAPPLSASQAIAAGEAAKASEATKPVEPTQSAAKETEVPTAGAKQPAAPTSKPEPRVAQADSLGDDMPKDLDGLIDKLDGQEFGDGYGVKKLDNGDCRLKVPFVTVTVPCKK